MDKILISHDRFAVSHIALDWVIKLGDELILAGLVSESAANSLTSRLNDELQAGTAYSFLQNIGIDGQALTSVAREQALAVLVRCESEQKANDRAFQLKAADLI